MKGYDDVVGKSSWKKREVRKFLIGKSEVGKFLFKLESSRLSWEVLSEVGKFSMWY